MNKTLYHYCTSNSFVSIIRSKSLWLSSLSLSNDSMEGRLLYKAFCKLMEKDSYDSIIRSNIEKSLLDNEEIFDGLGFCLSEVGDLLSQWRGYADDGYGFSIGFASEYLEELSNHYEHNKFFINKVVYCAEEQEQLLLPIYDSIKEDISSGKIVIPRNALLEIPIFKSKETDEGRDSYREAMQRFWVKMLDVLPSMFVLKSEAFSEEKEYRLISMLLKGPAHDCLFMSRRDRLIPYRKYDIAKLNNKPITSVIIGPKNITPEPYIEMFLKNNGFDDVNVYKSSATYR